MITGAHSIIYSTDPAADRAFLRDVLNLPHVDAGEGWLIFALPPAEVAVHPSEKNDVHELYLLCDDIKGFSSDMMRLNIPCSPVREQGWGLVVDVTLPGGGRLGIYQPRHVQPKRLKLSAVRKKAAAARKKKSTGRAVRRRSKKTGR